MSPRVIMLLPFLLLVMTILCGVVGAFKDDQIQDLSAVDNVPATESNQKIFHHDDKETAASERYARFYDWFRSHGGVANKVGVDSFGDMGLGVVALDKIAEGEEILKIPLSIVFSAASLAASKDPLHVKLAKVLPSEEAVLFAVLIEKLRGKDSAFGPYIAMLPEYVPSLIHFASDELEELQNDKLVASALQQQQSRKKLLESSLAKIKAAKMSLPQDVLDQINEENYLWASSIVDSRGLRFSGKVYLAPFSDFFNYKPHPEMRRSDAGKFYLDHHKLLEKDNMLVVSVDRDYVSKGEQVFEDYGDNDDSIYITYHGFVPDENPFRCFLIQGIDYKTLPSRTQRFLEDLGFKGGTAPSSCVSPVVGDLDKGLEVYLTATSMSEQQIEDCTGVISRLRKDRLPVSNVYLDCGLGAAYHQARDLLSSLKKTPQLEADRKDSQDWKILAAIHKSVLASANTKFQDSIGDDLAKKESLVAQLNAHDQHDVIGLRHIQHMLLATRYRISSKQAYEQLWQTFATPVSEVDSTVPQNIVKISPSADVDAQLEFEIQEFNVWFQEAISTAAGTSSDSKALSHVVAAVIPGYRIGTIASQDILAEDIYLGVPGSIIMDADKAASDFTENAEVSINGDIGVNPGPFNKGVGELIASLQVKYKKRDAFHELLFYLLSETFLKREQSKYYPYIRLLPSPQQLDNPLLWDSETVQSRLKPSKSMVRSILDYHEKVASTYAFLRNISDIVEFFVSGRANKSNSSDIFTFENYRWANAILDSRSIWWQGQRHLVPMLDFVNCKEGPENPSRVHSTTTASTGRGSDVAITKAPWAFKRGEQVFENYGQPNHIYYMYHGFVLQNVPDKGIIGNSHDCLHMDFVMKEDELAALKSRSAAEELGKVSSCSIP
jgi:histone-lysine N-methyltransferase SETD3